MRLEEIELRLVDLSLRDPVGTSDGVHGPRPVVLLRVVADGVEGWGECGALATGTSVDPSADVAYEALSDGGVTRLLEAVAARDGELPPWAMVRLLFGAGVTANMVGATIEMALLDAELRSTGRSLCDQLAQPPGPVAVGGMVGIPGDRSIGSLVARAADVVATGVDRLRVKIAPGWDLEPLTALRAQFADLALLADANAAYRLGADGPTDARGLRVLDGLGLTCIEQPLPAADLAGHAELRSTLETPIGLDESLSSPERVRDALRYGACQVACLKPARLGGVVATRAALAHCVAAGVPAFVGGFFETGLARSANASLATLEGFSLAGDLSNPADYLDLDPFGFPEVRHGRVVPPPGPGLSPPPDTAALDARSITVRRFAPGRGGGAAGAA